MQKRRIVTIAITLVVLAGMLSFSPGQTQVAQAQAGNVVYNLYATDGYIRLADGTTTYVYGFVGGREGVAPYLYLDSALAKKKPETVMSLPNGVPAPTAGPITAAERPLAGNAQFPAPVIYAATGDVVEIRLKNLGVNAQPKAPNDPHSIHLHGLDVDAANDGVPETSLGAVPANAALPGAGNVVVYMFTPTMPGTYMYHCHQEASIHVAMGMYGALVVYNPWDAGAVTGPNTGGGELYGWQYDKDYILLLSDMDLNQNRAEEQASAFNNTLYRPQYWFINGLSFPSTIHVAPPGAPISPNFLSWWDGWIATHPGYDPFITGSVSAGATGTPGEKVLLRVINMGFQAHPMHMHGYHGKIIGSDQRGWAFANNPGTDPNFINAQTPFNAGMEKNTLLIGSGETYEWLIDFGQQAMAAGTYAPGMQSRYDPVTNQPVVNTDLNFPAIPDPFVPGAAFVGGPVVGPDSLASQGPGGLPPDLPYTTGQYFPFHNHNDYQATNNGVYPGGMFTMIMTTP